MKPCNIFQLQRLSVNDGEGIRTTIFFKGCDLRCRWCANPESWSFEAQTIFFPHKCTACGNCLKSCLHHANKRTLDGKIAFISLLCQNCKACIVNCPNNARQSMGSYMSITEVISEIKKDLLFYEESGGGITLSGGEPLLHTLYIAELMQATTKLGIDVALESCAYFDFELNKSLLPKFSQIFFDIKVMDDDKHRFFTGVSNHQILNNIKLASQLNDNIIIRVPTIVGVNADSENFHQLASFLVTETTIKKVELLPYHELGREKMQALGFKTQKFQTPTAELLAELEAILKSYELEIVSYK